MGGGSPFGKPASKPSPFEADKARKGREDLSAADARPTAQSSQPVPGALEARPAAVGTIGSIQASSDDGALAVATQMENTGTDLNILNATGEASMNATLDVDAIREAVLQAMESGGSQMLVHALEEGAWAGEGNAVSIQVAMSASMIELSYTREQERLSNQAATRVAGRAVKVRLAAGAVSSAEVRPRRTHAAQGSGSESIKTRAAGELVVKRMMEKFGAEIRIVMDRSER